MTTMHVSHDNDNLSQSALILRTLRFHRGQWVSMPELSFHSGSYAVHSRIAELRRRGHDIDCHVDHAPRGRKKSFYRLNGK